MKTKNILDKIDSELKRLAKNPKNIKDYSKFHKDGKKHISLTTPLIRKVSATNFKETKGLEKTDIFSLCEQLLRARENSRRDIAFDWAFRLRKKYQKEDFKVFEAWLTRHVDTWGSCDDLCTHAFGDFMYQFPEFLPQAKKWARSKNKWLRRASAVVLIYSLRRGKYLEEAFATAKILMKDSEDLVQKGYGWMLKEASNLSSGKVFEFIMQNKTAMPRVALRYSVEKFPNNLKKKAMA